MGECKTLSIPMTTGDSICQQHSFKPDCIKIDVEGHEIAVLRGLSETIYGYRPIIFLEIHPERIQRNGNSLHELAMILKQFGYRADSIWGSQVSLDELQCAIQDLRLILHPLET
jgi:hypothetical protein